MILSLLVTAATAQGPVMIRYAPPVNSIQRYRFVQTMNQEMPGMGSANSMKATTEMTMKILSRKGSLTTLESTSGRMKIDLPPNSPMAGMKKQMEATGGGAKMLTVMDATGKVVSVKPLGKNGASAMAANMGQNMPGAVQGLSFPNRPVRVGETWKASLDFGKLMKTSSSSPLPKGMTVSGVMPTSTRLAGVRQEGGKTLANLKFTMDGSMIMGMQGQKFVTKTKTSGDAWIEVGTGITHSVKMVSSSTTDFGGRAMTQKMTMTMTKL